MADSEEFQLQGLLWLPKTELAVLRHQRTAVGRWPLAQLLAELPRIQYGEFDRANWPSQSFLKDAEPHAIRLACSELARQALLWARQCPRPEAEARLKATDRDLALLVSNALALRLELDPPPPGVAGVELSTLLYPFFAPQAEYMRNFGFRGSQARWMFIESLRVFGNRSADNHDRAVRLRQAFEAELSMSLDQFCWCVEFLFARSISATPFVVSDALYLSKEIVNSLGSLLVGVPPHGLVETPALAVAFSQLAQDACAHRASYQSETLPDRLLRRMNPLGQRPIVRPYSEKASIGVAPVPHLLFEYLYEPLTTRLFRAAQGCGLNSVFHLLFEEYVGLLLQRHAPVGSRWFHESELLATRVPAVTVVKGADRVVDWCCEFRDHFVMVDAKRAWLDPEARHRLDEGDWTSFRKTLRDVVDQAAKFWQSVVDGRLPQVKTAKSKQPLLLVALSSDARMVPGIESIVSDLVVDVGQKCPVLKVAVVWLDQLHALLATWHEREHDWLPVMLESVGVGFAGALNSELLEGVRGPLWDDALERTRLLARLNRPGRAPLD